MGKITETHVAVAIISYYGNGESWRRNKYTSDFNAWM